MADKGQVELLKRGPQVWNAWRVKQPEATVDLSGGALRGLDLTGADLTGADLQRADLRGAVLKDANLSGARLGGANLFKAILDDTDLKNTDLLGVQFIHCAQLQAAHNWRSAYRDDDLACGASVPAR